MDEDIQTITKNVRLLVVEDSEDEVFLLISHLRREGYQPEYECVENAGEMEAALRRRKWDVIIADYFLPDFSGLEVLKFLQTRKLDIPCIIISGKITDAVAVAALKAGACDFVARDNLCRLGPAIERELREASMRAERRQTAALIKETAALNAELERKLRRELEIFNHKIIQAQEDERKRVVRELHEDIVQLLAIIKLELESLSTSPDITRGETREKLQCLLKNTDSAMQNIRRFSYSLRPGDLDNLGLDASLEQLVEDTGNQCHIRIDFQVSGESRRLGEDESLVLFRIAQEALSNIYRHSRATEASVNLEYLPDRVRMRVCDNGQGFDNREEPDKAVSSGKLGLIGMRERAHLIKADLTVDSRKSQGTVISVDLKTPRSRYTKIPLRETRKS